MLRASVTKILIFTPSITGKNKALFRALKTIRIIDSDQENTPHEHNSMSSPKPSDFDDLITPSSRKSKKRKFKKTTIFDSENESEEEEKPMIKPKI